jgi:hypothetical protein
VRFPSFLRRTLPGILAAALACSPPPPPPDPAVVDAWIATTRDVSRDAEPSAQARVAALGALAMYEAFVAGNAVFLRSLAGQVNGLWSVPLPANRDMDAVIVAAEAQRVVLDSLLADAKARAAVDSLAAAQVAERRAAGVREETAQRSIAHGAAVARAVLSLRAPDAQRTLVLRHPQECVLRVASRSAGVVPQGEGRAPAQVPGGELLAAAESRVLDALVAADSVTAARKPVAGTDECVRALVQGRIRTRSASP